MENTTLIQNINKDLAIALPEKISLKELHQKLSLYINHCIKNNFQQVINMLYRIDVSEDRLKKLLHDNPAEDAANIIASLIIERQQQKIAFKNIFKNKPLTGDNEEKW
jgi:hypothetical protein